MNIIIYCTRNVLFTESTDVYVICGFYVFRVFIDYRTADD